LLTERLPLSLEPDVLPQLDRIDDHPRHWYIAAWKKTFEELLGSAEPALGRTLECYQDQMADKNGWFYTETPLHYIVWQLGPAELRESLDVERQRRLRHELEAAITPPGDYPGRYFPDTTANYDWEAVRSRVRNVLINWRAQTP
jgi:hypothetical protein